MRRKCPILAFRRNVSKSGDGGIALFETASGLQRLRLDGHARGVAACAFTPDAKTIVSVSADSTVLIWDVTGRRAGGEAAGVERAGPRREEGTMRAGVRRVGVSHKRRGRDGGRPPSLPLRSGALS